MLKYKVGMNVFSMLISAGNSPEHPTVMLALRVVELRQLLVEVLRVESFRHYFQGSPQFPY